MSITTGIAIYFVVWWVVLFAVLPWGVEAQHDGGPYAQGTDPGAPAIPAIARKLVWTTIISALVFGVSAVLYHYRIVTLDDLAILWGSLG